MSKNWHFIKYIQMLNSCDLSRTVCIELYPTASLGPASFALSTSSACVALPQGCAAPAVLEQVEGERQESMATVHDKDAVVLFPARLPLSKVLPKGFLLV